MTYTAVLLDNNGLFTLPTFLELFPVLQHQGLGSERKTEVLGRVGLHSHILVSPWAPPQQVSKRTSHTLVFPVAYSFGPSDGL